VGEVGPFWLLAVISLALSTWAADFTASHTRGLTPQALRTLVISVAYLSSFLLTWVTKFYLFNRFLFVGGTEREPR
jgi:hypothetical protein